MKKATTILFSVTVIAIIGCASMGSPQDELLVNPSLHIMVNDHEQAPLSGTFDFDTKLFKVNYSKEIDLAGADRRIITALQAALEKKGYQRSTEQPDMLVSYAVALDSPLSGADLNNAYAEEFPISFPDLGSHQEMNYHQGAFIVDFVDRESRKLLWRGAIMAEITIVDSDTVKERRARLGVQLLLDHFPKPIEDDSGAVSMSPR